MRLIDADALIKVLSDKYLIECFLTDAQGVIQLLKDTPTIEDNDLIAGMISDDYKERFKAEYKQLKIRRDRLAVLIEKYANRKLDFELDTPIKVLLDQWNYMTMYMVALIERAGYEDINLD